MKEQRLELRLSELELKRLEFLVSEVEREYGFKISLQQATRALMQIALGDEPEGGFETSKGKFGLVGIISNFKGGDQKGWEQEKKIKEALATNRENRDFESFVEEYGTLIKKANLNEKEKSRLVVLEKRAEKESQKIQAEKAKIRQWQKEGRYYSRRSRKEEGG